jgi:hypothetical protein
MNSELSGFGALDKRDMRIIKSLLRQVNKNTIATAKKAGVDDKDIQSRLQGPYLGSNDSVHLGSTVPIVDSVNPIERDLFAGSKNFEDLLDDYHESLKQYFAGLLNPEYAYQKGLQIKIPNPLPIPSVTLTQISSFHINDLPQGYFWLCWNPNFGSTVKAISQFKFSDNANFSPATGACSCFYGTNKNELKFHADSLPDVEASRMRLVSAKMKVTYRGSQENLSGKLYSCATFQPMPNVILRDDGTIPESPIYFYDNEWFRPTPNDLLSFAATGYNNRVEPTDYTKVLESQSVLNGLWSRPVTLSDFNRGLSCTYLPLDPECQTFNAPGTIRGSSLMKYLPPQAYNTRDGDYYLRDHAGAPIIDLYAGKMAYFVVGEGLPKGDNNAAIDVEFYYNWELLPTVSSASSMRNFNTSIMPSQAIYQDMIGSLNLNDATVRLVTTNNIGRLEGWDTIKSWLKPVGRGVAKVLSSICN